MLECNIAHRRNVAALRILYKYRCNPMNPLHVALPVPYVPVLVAAVHLVTHRYIYAPTHPLQDLAVRQELFLSVTLLNDPMTQYSIVWDWGF